MHLDTDFWDLCIGEFVGAWFLCPIFFYFVWQVLYLVKTEMLDRKVTIYVFFLICRASFVPGQDWNARPQARILQAELKFKVSNLN